LRGPRPTRWSRITRDPDRYARLLWTRLIRGWRLRRDPPGAARFLFREGLRRARRQRHLKSVQRVSDRRVIADDRAKFDDPLLAEPRDRLGKGGVGEPLGIDQLTNDAMDEDLVRSREAGRGAGADGLDRLRWDSGLDR